MRNVLPSLLIFIPLCLIPLSCDGKSGGSSNPGGTAPPLELGASNPDAVTLEIIEELTHGKSDDFSTMSARLDAVVKARPTQWDAFLLKAITDYLAFTRQTSMGSNPSGDLKDLYEKCGYENTQANFWDFKLQKKSTTIGYIADSTSPYMNTIRTYIDGKWRQALLNLSTNLGKIPASFDCVFDNLEVNRGAFGSFFRSNSVARYYVDYGDVMMMKTQLDLLLAWIDLLMAYSWDNVLLNDFDAGDPNPADPLALINTKYLQLGKLLYPQRLTDARNRITAAFNSSYKNAAGHILNESDDQQRFGIITIHKSKFGTPQERDQFLLDEAYFRGTWMPAMLAAQSSSSYLIDKKPTGGTSTTTLLVNFAAFWSGIDLRANFLKTILDPFQNHVVFGVSDPKQIVAGMYTYGGFLRQRNGIPPAPGDNQNSSGGFPCYPVRIDTILAGTKTIDGNFSDWAKGTNCNLAATSPKATVKGNDLGEILVAKDTANLYLAITQNNLSYKPASGWFFFEIEVSGPNYNLVIYYYWYTQTLRSRGGAPGGTPPTIVTSPGGIEIQIPLNNFTGSWVELINEIERDSLPRSTTDFWAERGPIFLKIR